MTAKAARQLSPQELQVEYNHLARKYYDLKVNYRKRAEKYNSLLKSKRLLSKQIQMWSRRFQRLKITIGASSIKSASFQDYAASFETSNDEIKRLEALVLDLSLRNCELEQSLEQSQLHAKAPQWKNDRMVANGDNSPVVVDFSAIKQQASAQQAAAAN